MIHETNCIKSNLYAHNFKTKACMFLFSSNFAVLCLVRFRPSFR